MSASQTSVGGPVLIQDEVSTVLWWKSGKKDPIKDFSNSWICWIEEFTFILRLDLAYFSERPSFYAVVTMELFVLLCSVLLFVLTLSWHRDAGSETYFWKCSWSERSRSLRTAVSTTHVKQKRAARSYSLIYSTNTWWVPPTEQALYWVAGVEPWARLTGPWCHLAGIEEVVKMEGRSY